MAAGVRLTESNRTYGISSTGTTYCASVFAAKRGNVDRANNCNSVEDFIKRSTASEWINTDDSIGYFDALNILNGTANYTFIRAANNPLYGGAYVRSAGAVKTNNAIEFGFASLSGYDLDTQDGRSILGPTPFYIDIDKSVTNLTVNESLYQQVKTGDVVTFSVEGEDSSLPTELKPETKYYAVKQDEKNQIALALTKQNIKDLVFVVFTSNGQGTMLVNNTSVISEDKGEEKCLLFYDSTPGNFNVSIKISPYRGEEIIKQFSKIEYELDENGKPILDEDGNPTPAFKKDENGDYVTDGSGQMVLKDPIRSVIITNQNWSNGEAVRFVSSGTLPEGLLPYVNYYIRHTKDGYRLCEKYSDAIGNITPPYVEFGDTYKGTVRMIPTDTVCKDEGCFVISIYTDKSRDVAVESFTCSRIPGKKDSLGQNTYVEDVLRNSRYVRCKDNVSVPETILPQAQSYHLFLSNGSFGNPVTDSDMVRAAQALTNSSEVPLTLISDAGWTTPMFQNTLLSICEKRRDCFAVLSVPYDLVRNNNPNAVADCISYRRGYTGNSAGLLSTRFGALYAPWLLMTDAYNDRKIYVPPAGLVVGTIAKNALNYALWYVHAGSKRGRLAVEGVSVPFSYTLAGDGDIAMLEDNQINPIIKQQNGQIDIWGNQTLEATTSDTSYIHTSLSLITIQPYVMEYLRNNWLWDFQTNQNLADIQIGLQSFLAPLKTSLAIENFSVKVYSIAASGSTMSTQIGVDITTVHLGFIKNIHYTHIISRNINSTVSVSSATVTSTNG